MQELLIYLKSNKKRLNLAEISREAGYDSSYLKKIVSGDLNLTVQSTKNVREALDRLLVKHPGKESKA